MQIIFAKSILFMKIIKIIKSIIFIALIYPINAIGELKFESNEISDTILDNVTAYHFSYKFQNTGNTPIKITSIEQICGCTIIDQAKKVYEKDEKGVISGVFDVENRIGLQEKIIFIKTDDLGQSVIKLYLNINILKTLDITPQLLFWSKNSKAKEKNISVNLNKSELVSISIEGAEFNILKYQNGNKKNEFIITVSPKSTQTPAKDKLEIKTKGQDGKEKSSYVYLLIR